MKEKEHEIQAAFFDYCIIRAQGDNRYRSIFAVPNAGLRSPAAANYYKREGLRPGVPDIFVAVPSQGYSGLFIEMKRPKETVSAEQREWLDRLSGYGYLCAVARSTRAAMKLVENYFK